MTMGRKKKKARATAFLALAALLFLALSPWPARAQDTVPQGYQQQLNQVNEKLGSLAQQEAQLQEELSRAGSLREEAEAQWGQVSGELDLVREELALLTERVLLLELDVACKQADLEALQEEYRQNYSRFLQRLRSMQLEGSASSLGALLGAEDYITLLSMEEQMARIARHDRQLLADLRDGRQQMETEAAELAASLALLAADQNLVLERRQSLSAQEQDISGRIHDIALQEQQYLADLEANQAAQKQAEAQLEEIYRQIQWSSSAYVGGEMAWPLPGYYTISSPYGMRWGTEMHTGTDITGTGVMGAPVVAANAGTVRHTQWTYTENVGYGMYVLIDHGGNTSTMYAHLSGIGVTEGQTVTRGQTIGYVGSTGRSTGPHLHFEVRVNTNHQNPMGYITAG